MMPPIPKPSLIDDWRRAWRLFSVQLFALIALFPSIYDGIAAMGWMDQLPEQARWAVRALGAVGIVARVIKQRPQETP